MTKSVLLTGGAGYIGSHTCHQLIEANEKVVVIDNFYSGHRWAVPDEATLVEGDAGDIELTSQLMREHGVDTVIHFAGHIVVPESVTDPLKYYRNNTQNSRNLLQACINSGVDQFVFSSTAAVYGIPEQQPATEQTNTVPINAYGRSKLMTEWMMQDLANRPNIEDNFRFIALRYFNVAGARADLSIGQATPEATHLIKVACQTALGLRNSVSIFGTDYPTPDGTGVRDYIHVEDLASAHLSALNYLRQGGDSTIMNCGYGQGYSVRDVMQTVRKVSGVDFKIIETPRRAGDPPELIADNRLIHQTLDWKIQYQDLEVICQTAYDWEEKWARVRNKSR
ncbi:MAG: UDP-glucose 4-epimerase GalE [Gammaproteobacteria bacterium]|nr:UDP-glucose 4-epimerase GalE [Gammaproteobacteria bacterium]